MSFGLAARQCANRSTPHGSRLGGAPAGWLPAAIQLQVRSINKSCGLVGYPNVGKSTLFNAFVGTTLAAAENFPFCTIDPNVCKVGVKDEQLETLAKTCGSLKVVPGTVEIRDIAGLIKGASSGAGMGNEFLSQIRGVQVILHVVRCFSNPDIVHVIDPVNIDPVAEYESVLEELIIADLELASKRLPLLRKKAKVTTEIGKLLPFYEEVLSALEDGKPARTALTGDNTDEPIAATDEFLVQLITAKPVVVLANVAAEDAKNGNAYTERLSAHIAAAETASKAAAGQRRCVVVSAPLEAEVVQLDDVEFQQEYLESYGLEDGQRAMPRVLAECKELLGIVSYLTVGEVEARAWFVAAGSRANEAAGAIHGDFVKNFEQADVWNSADILRLGGKAACRKAGLVKSKGKDYEVKDGDVLEFKVKNARS